MGWVKQLLGFQLSEGVRGLIVGGSLLGVLLLAGAILVNELRVAGVLGRARRGRGAAAGATPAATQASLQQLARSARDEHAPQLLLDLIVKRLRDEQRLPPARALTVRELATLARLTDAGERERLAQLGAACERLRFAPTPLTAPALAAAVRAGRELLSALSGDATRAAGNH
jgi:hypothetical protein